MSLKKRIDANTRDGKVAVVVWGRDCDLCESTELVSIDASEEAYAQLYYSVEDGAEGPFWLNIISPEEADQFTPHMRDLAAEMMGY